MPGEDAQRLRDIFLRVIELPPGRRAHAVGEACAGRPDLRAGVERLLGAHERAGDFLSGATFDSGGPHPGAYHRVAPGPGAPDAAPLREGPGATIGRYRLVEQVGEGGFGVVFRAEQTEPVRRTVALKIIKLGMDTRQVVAR